MTTFKYVSILLTGILTCANGFGLAENAVPPLERNCGEEPGMCQYNEMDMNGNCVVLSGGSCFANPNCTAGAVCKRFGAYKRCECDDKHVEQTGTGICLNAFNNNCTCTSDCSKEFLCLGGKCACPVGTQYNPDADYEIPRYAILERDNSEAGSYSRFHPPMNKGRCEIDIGVRCNLDNYEGPTCSTNTCGWDSNRCECPEFSKYDSKSRKCVCGDVTYEGEYSICKPFSGASCNFENNGWTCKCPSGIKSGQDHICK